MAIEGLKVILEKEPVVPTPTADRLMTAPETVDATFLRHVRSYVPFGRAASGGEQGEISIAEYEKRLIDKVKASAAPKGYITADFGYGKTSTALYLWDRCRAAGLLTVPPFQLGRLDDLIHATFGWARYELGRTAPALVPDLEALYRSYTERSIEVDAGGNAAVAETLRALLATGRYHLKLVATDYVTFFERLAELGKQAGFAGLVILPDEVQQYLDPAIRGGYDDPIAPLHNVVEALNTRRGRLPVGLIFSLPRKELGVINDQRGDLVHRLKMDGLGLDLSTVYDKRFASRLWQRLADVFDFAEEARRIVTAAALDALGQIAARDDLANGPRTVIAAFAWMTRRFLDANGQTAAVTPVDLVDAFLDGAIVFDGTSKLQSVTQTHLESPLVAGRPGFRRTVKALAAFPTDGAIEPVLRELGLWESAEELDRLARGDITIQVGGGLDDRGERVPYGYTLRGLEPQSAVAQDWLSQTLREFSRSFSEGAEKTIERAESGFVRLLTDVVFRPPHWKRIEMTERRRADGANRSLLFEGSFSSTAKRYPERRVLVRILRDEEQPDRGRNDVDVTFDVTLALRLDRDHQRRRALPGSLDQDAGGKARLTLNLFHREGEDYYPELRAVLQPVMMPNLVTPLLMLALHEYLEEKRRAALIPKEEDHQIEHLFQRPLLEHSADELFNRDLGSPFNARGPRLVEEVFRALVEARYPLYRTLIRQQGWTQTLKDYELALERLANRYERQGAPVALTRDETAKLFNRTNTALDSFIDTFPDLISVEPKFKGREKSQVRFKLHPFEEHVCDLLRRGEPVTTPANGRKVQVRMIALEAVERAGANLGYRQREIGVLLDMMAKRELVEVLPQRGTIQEVPLVQLTADDLKPKVTATLDRVNRLLVAFPDDPLLTQLVNPLRQIQQQLNGDRSVDEQTILKFDSALRGLEKQLATFLDSKLSTLQASAKDVAVEQVADPRQTYRLADPIEGNFFAPHLDAIRRKLLDEADTLRKRRDFLKQRTLDVVGKLNAEAATDEGVIRGQEELVTLRRDAQQLADETKALDNQGRQLATARRVLAEAIELNGMLAFEGLSTHDPGLTDSFRALMEQIQAELSSRKEAAIDRADHWDTALRELRNRFNTRINAERETFEHRKARYRELLQTYAYVPPDRDPLQVTFNAADPAGSHHLLDEQVSRVLVSRLCRLTEALTRSQTDLRQLLASGDLAFTDNPSDLEAECRRLIEEIASRIEAIQPDIKRAEDVTALGAIETDGAAVAVFRSFEAHALAVKELAPRHAAIMAAVKPRQLEPAERNVLEAIERVTSGTELPLDVGALLDDPSVGVRSLDQLWPLIDGLYRKRRIRVRLEPTRTTEPRPADVSSRSIA